MQQIELLRNTLYTAIKSGNADDILKASQELDKLIVVQLKHSMDTNRKTA